MKSMLIVFINPLDIITFQLNFEFKGIFSSKPAQLNFKDLL